MQQTNLRPFEPNHPQSANVKPAFLRLLIEAAAYVNTMHQKSFLQRQTVDKVALTFNEVQKELNLLTEEAKNAFREDRALTDE